MAARRPVLPVVAAICVVLCTLVSAYKGPGENLNSLSLPDKVAGPNVQEKNFWSKSIEFLGNWQKRFFVVDSKVADTSYFDSRGSSLVAGESYDEVVAALPQSRQRRAVGDVSISLSEYYVNQSISLANYVPGNVARTYTLVSSSVDINLFSLSTTTGILSLRAALDFENLSTRMINLEVSATSNTDKADVYVIRALINVMDVNEPAVFVSKPQPYLATLTTNVIRGTRVIQLQAYDPDEGAVVGYSLTAVTLSDYFNLFELKEAVAADGLPYCEILTASSWQSLPEGQVINITVTAKDKNSASAATTTTVSVLVGLRAPQFMESLYWGYVLQNNHPHQMVYAQADGSRGLKVDSKLFQPDEPVTYSLLDSTGLPSPDFAVDDDGLVINLHTIDYENPPAPLAQLEVRGVQSVGTDQLTSTASVLIRIGNIDIGPEFETSQYLTTEPEDKPINTQIVEVKAKDHTNAKAVISYSLNDTQNFSIVTEYRNGFYVGIISVGQRLDYDRLATHYYDFIVLAAVDGQPASKTNSASVRVHVTNVNDEAPEFVNEPGKIFTVPPNLQPGSVVTQILAFDRDGDRVSYSFTEPGEAPTTFSLASDTGTITLVSAFTEDFYEFVLSITASDDGSCCGGGTSLSSTTSIMIRVMGANVNKPTFTNCSDYDLTSVTEESANYTFVMQVSAADPDKGVNGEVTYSLVTPTQYLTIEPSNGTIYVAGRIDREALGTERNLQVIVVARDGGIPHLESKCGFRLQVEDINDNAPVFEKTVYSVNITSQTTIWTTVLAVLAYDDDFGSNAEVEYSLFPNPDDIFGIVTSSGSIYLNKQLQQTQTSYTLTVMAKDKGVPPLSSTTSVIVTVYVSTNKSPSFDKNYTGMQYNISEAIAPGSSVIDNIICNSNINEPRVSFVLIDSIGGASAESKYFKIKASESLSTPVNISAKNQFDFETRERHVVRLLCVNLDSVTLSSEVDPLVQLIDANDNSPTFIGLDTLGRLNGAVSENLDAGQECLTIIGQDLDVTPLFSKLTFEISANDNGSNNMDFELVRKDDRSAVLRTKRSFDREAQNVYFIQVIAKDGAPSANKAPNPNSDSITVRVDISDVNDNPPYFNQSLYTLGVPEDVGLNQSIEPNITAEDRDDTDKNRLSYFIDSGNGPIPTFGVREGSGGLFLVQKLDYEAGTRSFQLTLRAFDGTSSATTTVVVNVLDVNDNNPVLSPSSFIIEDIIEEDTSVIGNPRLLLKFSAADADLDRPNVFQFSIADTLASQFFEIRNDTGELYLIYPLDRDLPYGRANFIISVQVTDELVNPRTSFAFVFVMPLDINDNDPTFLNVPMMGSVNEHSENGSFVMVVSAFDPDFMENGTVVFSILRSYDTSNASGTYFTIDSNTGNVTTNVAKELLDREKDPALYMVIKLADKGTPPRSTTGTFTVVLHSANSSPPIFEQRFYTVEMSEALPKNGEVVTIRATYPDITVNYVLIYWLPVATDRIHFDITTDQSSGKIIVFKPVDYDPPWNQRSFNLTISVTDGRFSDTCYVEIKVTDFNDNAPQIEPKNVNVELLENATVGTFVANFSATDNDEGINAIFQFSIDRKTDPLRQFTIDPPTGVVRVRRPLDRETTASYNLHILAIDQGKPPLTGTATLSVILEDVNDNYPTFLNQYQPQVPENDPDFPKDIQPIIYAKDPDLPPYSYPYGFSLTSCNDGSDTCPCDGRPSCQAFGFRENRVEDNGNGVAIVSTKMQYDREEQKYYEIPIVMWDMYGSGSPFSQTGTNTLTVTIADKNDNSMRDGHQDIFVLNYEGMFGPIDIGRVYVNDPDDWDLPDKTFTFLEPKWMEAYFQVLSNGTIVMQKGVPSNSDSEKYTFSVQVVDNVRNEKVVATVSVVVNDLSDEAVRSSGAVRLQGISAEDFIKRPPLDTNTYGESPYDKFRKLLAQKLGTALENVLIISVQDVEGGVYTDVRYTAHGSPYYQSSQTDSLVVNNLQEFETTAGIRIVLVPIDMCAEEFFEGGCYNYLDVTGRPAMVNSNGTSFVGVETFVLAREGCRARDFPDPVECSGDYCYNGGTCKHDDFGVLSCLCLAGFDGPRCQQLRHSFDGKSYAMYPTLEQCEDSETAIEFMTTQSDGLLLYNGPKVTPSSDQPRDFISLELRGGFPVLMIDHGTGATSLAVDGLNSDGNVVMSSLADGKWHRIDIIRTGRHVEMIVDFCESAASRNEGGALDDRPCRATSDTPGDYTFLNVGTLLQLGGRQPSTNYPPNVAGTGFNGCVRNLRHNSKLYDLHYKEIPGVSSGQNGCPREDDNCGASCGVNGVCTPGLTPAQAATCVCKPGWRGNQCTTETTVRDLDTSSYFKWTLSYSFVSTSVLPYKIEMQAMFRTRDDSGVIFAIFGTNNGQHITLQIADSKLQVRYNLDNTEEVLELSLAAVSNGQWHVAKVVRNLQHVTLILDGGEGRNYNYSRGNPDGSFSMALKDTTYVGWVVSSLQGTADQDLVDTCVQDIRLNNVGFPMTQSENADGVSLTEQVNVKDGCTRDDCTGVSCPPGTFCYPLWGKHECRCDDGTHSSGTTCVSNCTPNPCFNNVACSINNGSVICACPPEWCGPLCQYYLTSSTCSAASEEALTAGLSIGGIAAIVVSIVAALLIVLFAVMFFVYCRKRALEKVVVETEDDYDIRENVMYYDEEGAGEEDQNAYDLDTLRKTVRELQPDIRNAPLRREPQLGRAVPEDRLDVGDTIQDRVRDAEDDPDAPPYDTLYEFNLEGGGSEAGSLSSLATSSSDASQDYDYLHEWGPKFAKLADMYGTGREEDV